MSKILNSNERENQGSAVKQKVLIVEDEEVIADLLQRKLEKEGFQTCRAENGQVGLDLARKEKPDLIVLDLIMPKMDGFTLMAEIQKDAGLKGIPLVIVSNSGQPVELNRARELGAKDWLIKTEFDPQELVDKVRKQLNK